MGRAYKLKGFSLVEVLIALAVMSIALLGLVNVLVTGLKAQDKTGKSTVGHSVANRVLERTVRRLENMDSGLAGATFWTADISSESSPWTELGDHEMVGHTRYDYLITATDAEPGIFSPGNELKMVTVKVRWAADGDKAKVGVGKREIAVEQSDQPEGEQH